MVHNAITIYLFLPPTRPQNCYYSAHSNISSASLYDADKFQKSELIRHTQVEKTHGQEFMTKLRDVVYTPSRGR
jgi:hypothetical protein